MFGLGNIFSGLGNLFSFSNLLHAMDFIDKGLGLYNQIQSFFNPPKLPDFDRLDRMGNQAMPVTPQAPQMSPAQRAQQFASAKSHLAERGVYSGGAFDNPLAAAPGLFNAAPQSLYATVEQGQALPGFEDEEPYSGFGGY